MSEQFVVSALKYRPQAFDTVIGQSHITTTLRNAIINDKLAHSFLFCGPRGVGKTTCARILAKTINCTNRTAEGEACDTCNNCRTFNESTSFTVHELDAASNNSVDDIRGLIEQVRYAPPGGSQYKVYIIDEVHMLSQSAFNAFLKTLEEPPSYAIFILATTEKHKILPTILSRCQIFDFKRITTNDIIDHLLDICKQESIKAERDALHFIALKSEGCMRDALSIMDKIASFSGGDITYNSTIDNLNILDYDYYFKLCDALMLQSTQQVLLLVDEILSKGFEGDTLLLGLTEHLRNLMLCKDAEMVKLMDVAEGVKKKYYEQATTITQGLILNGISILSNADMQYKQSRNKRLHVEIAFIKLCNINAAVQVLSDANGTVNFKKLSNQQVKRITANANKPAQLYVQKASPAVTEVADTIIPSYTPSTNTQATTIISHTAKLEPQASIAAPPSSSASISLLSGLKAKAMQQLQQQGTLVAVPLTLDNLISNWQLQITELSNDNNFFKNALQQCSISFNEHVITITITNTMASNLLQEHKLAIIHSFKNTYSNDALELQYITDIKQEQSTELVKSKREQYEEMIINYPVLKQLKDRLGMEFEY
jgi:DNA polymerase III subunit gamma/tau